DLPTAIDDDAGRRDFDAAAMRRERSDPSDHTKIGPSPQPDSSFHDENLRSRMLDGGPADRGRAKLASYIAYFSALCSQKSLIGVSSISRKCRKTWPGPPD